MDGVMVVGFGNVTSTDGTCCPAEDAGFQKGDMIHAINTVPVNSSEEVQTSIRNAGQRWNRRDAPSASVLFPLVEW